MKSSTLIRSMLSKENMDMIESLSEENNNINNASEKQSQTPEEYVRSASEENLSKSQEIDLLWQNFKIAQFSNKSPAVYITIGFIGGILSTLLVGGIFGYFISKPDVKISLPQISLPQSAVVQEEQEDVNARVVVPDENGEPQVAQSNEQIQDSVQSVEENVQSSSGVKKHVVSDGETVEAIIKHYYGSYTPDRAEKIKQANNLKSLDRISIGQELIIP